MDISNVLPTFILATDNLPLAEESDAFSGILGVFDKSYAMSRQFFCLRWRLRRAPLTSRRGAVGAKSTDIDRFAVVVLSIGFSI